jgi:type III secretion protein SpaR/YscT/HrcT
MEQYPVILQWLAVAGLGMARTGAALLLLPFLNPSLIGGAFVKGAVTLVICVGLVPAIGPALGAGASIQAAIVGEVIVGLIIGVSLAAPFWVATAAGQMIDNQRGATISGSIDPGTGVDESPLSDLFAYYWNAVFVLGGGLVTIVEVLADSYARFPAAGVPALSLDLVMQVVALMGNAVGHALQLAAPATVGMLLTEALLGLLSRFAPRLNAFAVSMTVKSAVALMILLPYVMRFLPLTLTAFAQEATGIVHAR